MGFMGQHDKNVSLEPVQQYWNIIKVTLHLLDGPIVDSLFNDSSKSYLRKKLKPIKDDIRKLSKPQTSVKKKRELLKRDQTGKGVFSLLASVIIPSIISAIAGQWKI